MNFLLPISAAHFAVVSMLLVAAGIGTILSKRNAIGILIGVELVLNAAALNLVAFARYHPWLADGQPVLDGTMFAIFVVVLAAAEAAIALAIFLNFYNTLGSVDVEKGREMQG